MVMDSKLGNVIKEKMGIPCIFSSGVMELARGIRNQLVGLIRSACMGVCVVVTCSSTVYTAQWPFGASADAHVPWSVTQLVSLQAQVLS